MPAWWRMKWYGGTTASARSRVAIPTRTARPPRLRIRLPSKPGVAREAGRGLWSHCDATAAPDETPVTAPSGCDPSYPTVCIPSPPPDLDCGEIPFRRFEVIGSDPHGFDGDGDGVGCES